MEVTKDQIRQALVLVAKDRGRDYFELALIREVIFSIQNNIDHHLNAPVLEKIRCLQEEKCSDTSKARLKKLRSVCTNSGEKKEMASRLDISFKLFCSMLKGRVEIPLIDWRRMEPIIDREIEYRQKKAEEQSEAKVMWG